MIVQLRPYLGCPVINYSIRGACMLISFFGNHFVSVYLELAVYFPNKDFHVLRIQFSRRHHRHTPFKLVLIKIVSTPFSLLLIRTVRFLL